MRVPNKYCHSTKDVLEYLLSLKHELGEDSEWWDYATALRGCDMYESSKMTKFLFTCVVRGMGGENGADDIQDTIDTFFISYAPKKNSNAFPNVRKLIHSNEYGHFKAHIYSAFGALQVYYTNMALDVKSASKKDAKIYKQCSELCGNMGGDVIQSDNSNFENYCEHLYKFLKLVSEE